MTDWKATPLAPFAATSQDAPGFWLQGCLWTVLASGEQTGGQYSLIEQLMPGQAGPPPHVHDRQVEVFYILAGQMRLQVGTELMTASAGALISIPPRTPHGFRVLSDTARALNLLAGSKPAFTSGWLGADGGDHWLLTAVRGHLGGTRPGCLRRRFGA